MKTTKINLIIITLIMAFTSCSDDDTNKDNPTELDLTINLETAQDQIGDFACNAMTLFNNNVWSIGGARSATSNFNNEVWNSSNGSAWISGSTWTNNFETAPFGNVAYHDVVIFNNRLYVIAADVNTRNMKVWSSADGENWTEDTSNAFSARVSHKTVVFNNAMYVIGGEGGPSNIRLNEIWTSTDGINWSIISNNASVFPEINWHTATVYNNKVWIIGGRTNTATLLYDDALWVFGGYVGFEETTGKIWRITEN